MDKKDLLKELMFGLESEFHCSKIVIIHDNLPTSVDFLVIWEEAKSINRFDRGDRLFAALSSIFGPTMKDHLFVGSLITPQEYERHKKDQEEDDLTLPNKGSNSAAKSL